MSLAPYWPWWLGAAFLAAATVGHWVLTGRPLGISGAVSRLIDRVRWRSSTPALEALLNDPEVERRLLALTAEAFDDGPPAAAPASDPAAGRAVPQPVRAPRTPGLAATLVVALVGGGALARVVAGPAATSGMGELAWPGGAAGALVAAFAGGALVGVGTRLAGGCSSGHGLSGCASRSPRSFLATAIFFAAAAGASVVLEGVLP